jgi:hypothetical protein
MKLRNFSFVVAVVSSLIGSTAAVAGDADFTIVNKTGITINSIYLSPANKTAWGKERLGEGKFLKQGQSVLIKFSDKASCNQDMQVHFEDKNSSDLTWEDLNLCEINKLTLKYNKAKNEVSYDQE